MTTPSAPEPPFDVIVLAGGGARRLGGADKPALEVAGVSMLDRVLEACAGAASVAVVGPERTVARPVRWTLESPPGGGPVPAIAAGLAFGTSEVVAVFAADLPFLDAEAVELLRRSLIRDAVLFADEHGKDQPLAAVYRRHALTAALEGAAELSNTRLTAIVDRLAVTRIPDTRGVTADCDTWEAVESARGLLATASGAPAKMEVMDEKLLLAEWCNAAAAELGLAGHELTLADREAILALAGVAAHNVLRPAAPLTTFLAGYAVGLRSSAATGRAAVDGPIAKLGALAQIWKPGAAPDEDAAANAPIGGSVAGGHAAHHDQTRSATGGDEARPEQPAR